jgi:uncharacterized protein YegP (UPF0339 family)
MARKQTSDNALVSLYTEHITEPSTNDEVYGYWLFVVGVLASVVGVALFLYTTTLQRPPAAQGGTYWTVRELAVVLAAGGVPLILGGIAIRLPLRKTATWLTYLGILVCLAALAWFVTVYPASGWPTDRGHTGVIGLYTLGLAIIGLASVLVPMLSRAETETASERAAREERERDEAASREELDRTREERDEARAAAEASAAELEALRQSKARFELYEDRAGGHRWRLRHYNGNIVADSGEAYSSRQKCQQGLHSVKRNALGADIMRIEPDDPEEIVEETETEPIEIESQASFELYEDSGGEYRWRLRHDNGNVIADSGEGYASRSNAKRAMERVREHAAAADYLRIDPAGYELYRDRGGEWRWRLVHENGNILADSGEGYASRQKARQGLDSVRENAGDADVLVEEQ